MTALHSRLDNLRILKEQDHEILDRLLAEVRERSDGELVQAEGAPVEATRVMLSGWGIRFRTTPDGRRQIVNFVLPGDSVGLYGALFESSDSGVSLITDCRLAEFPCDELTETFRQSARLGAALCWIGGVDERFLEQQILRMGAMNATERIAHLLVELQRRLLVAGVAPVEAMTIPLTQKLAADALGLSAVHVNRCCRKLVELGLLDGEGEGFTILEPESLKDYCDFDAGFMESAGIPPESARRLSQD